MSITSNYDRDFRVALIKRVAKRVSDNPDCTIKVGIPRTDGRIIYLPLDDSQYSYLDLEALAAHEGGHIRFKSLMDPNLPKEICKENPTLGQIILNICEDGRIEFLLKETFPGFWHQLDILNEKLLIKKAENFEGKCFDNITAALYVEFLLFLISLIFSQKKTLVFIRHLYCDKRQGFCLSHKEIGPFWEKVQDIYHLMSYFSFP